MGSFVGVSSDRSIHFTCLSCYLGSNDEMVSEVIGFDIQMEKTMAIDGS
jgi:hypothetical protein